MTLLLCHIPKTAGTSLRRLAERFSPDAAFVYEPVLALGAPDLDFAKAFRARPAPSLLMGHFSYGVHRLLGLEPRYATVLREPIARVVSLYRFLKIDAASPFSAAARGMSLQAFIASGITEMTNNHMCRMIAGIPPEPGCIITDDWLLGLALHNLERHFALVGTLEAMPGFMASLAQALHWPAETQLPAENVTTGERPDLSADDLSTVTAHNRLDIELYATVSRRQG
ncbi:hypothetical protein [Ferrovibrio sp.]|uniref:hypothetical protein n=1 Tax=Ferrovibrio sp. TaxID=1917215 RepID=UPI003D103625